MSQNQRGMGKKKKEGREERPTDQATRLRSIPIDVAVLLRELSEFAELGHHVEHVGVDVDVVQSERVEFLNGIEGCFCSSEVCENQRRVSSPFPFVPSRTETNEKKGRTNLVDDKPPSPSCSLPISRPSP